MLLPPLACKREKPHSRICRPLEYSLQCTYLHVTQKVGCSLRSQVLDRTSFATTPCRRCIRHAACPAFLPLRMPPELQIIAAVRSPLTLCDGCACVVWLWSRGHGLGELRVSFPAPPHLELRALFGRSLSCPLYSPTPLTSCFHCRIPARC